MIRESQDLISDSYPHSHKAVPVWGRINKKKKYNIKFEK